MPPKASIREGGSGGWPQQLRRKKLDSLKEEAQTIVSTQLAPQVVVQAEVPQKDDSRHSGYSLGSSPLPAWSRPAQDSLSDRLGKRKI